jgi:hypothetical protein
MTNLIKSLKVLMSYTLLSFILAMVSCSRTGESSTVDIDFSEIQNFKEARDYRELKFKKINSLRASQVVKNNDLRKLDSLYWAKLFSLLADKAHAITHQSTNYSSKLARIKELRTEYDENRYPGISPLGIDSQINNALSAIDFKIKHYRHEQAWENRRRALEDEIRKQMASRFHGVYNTVVEEEVVDILDSSRIENDGEAKQMEYTIRYHKKYKGAFRWEVFGTGRWLIYCKTNDTYIRVVNLCEGCYDEAKLAN